MTMTKGDRAELQKLANKRERVAKAQVDQVAAKRLADFEQQAASQYRVHDDEVWAEQARMAREAVADANVRLHERCRELGIPPTVAEIEKASESYGDDEPSWRRHQRPWRLPIGEED
jgi:hypothetical protein